MLQRYHDTIPTGKRAFTLLPALDLRGGRVVRLLRGDFGAETVYGDDPAEAARAFVTAGAGWLHVVDLDGARDGVPRQAAAQAAILGGVGDRARVQLAGGLRDAAAVEAALAAGAARVVLGTAALDDPAFVAGLVARHGSDRIVVALDVRDGVAVGSGWVDGAIGTPVDTAAAALVDAGVRIVAVTAIARDGTMAGPDLALLERVVGRVPGAVIASGGIGSLDDLRRVHALGCAGAILGRALYEGRFSLPEALAAVG